MLFEDCLMIKLQTSGEIKVIDFCATELLSLLKYLI